MNRKIGVTVIIRATVTAYASFLLIGILHTPVAAAADDDRMKIIATRAWELNLEQLRWMHYWGGEQLPQEYVRGGKITITFFGTSERNSVGFCNRLTGYCSLYWEKEGIVERAGGWRFKLDCGNACQAAAFQEAHASATARLPLEHRPPPAYPGSPAKYFDPLEPIDENATTATNTPVYDQILTLNLPLEPLNVGDAEVKQAPPELEKLRKWAIDEAHSYLTSGCTDRVEVAIPFNVPKYESIYVSFRRSESCGDLVVLLNHYSDGWVRSLDIYDKTVVRRILALIDANTMDKFQVTQDQVVR